MVTRSGRVVRRLLPAASALVAATMAVSPVQASSAPLRFVALGDSYSAGSGVLPADPAAPLRCVRSLRNYPKVIAGQIGAQLTDVTCGGAKTSDFFTPQFQGAPPQL